MVVLRGFEVKDRMNDVGAFRELRIVVAYDRCMEVCLNGAI